VGSAGLRRRVAIRDRGAFGDDVVCCRCIILSPTGEDSINVANPLTSCSMRAYMYATGAMASCIRGCWLIDAIQWTVVREERSWSFHIVCSYDQHSR